MSRLISPLGRSETILPREMRQIWFNGWVETPVYWRDGLPLNLLLTGPAVIEQMDTTTLVDPGCVVESDPDGNLMIEHGHA